VRRIVNVGLIQMSCGEGINQNLEKTIEYTKQATSQGANIVCTQELFKSRYFPQVVDSEMFGLAERIDEDSPTLRQLCQLAAELDIVLIASLFEKRTLGLYHNTAVVIDADGRFLGKYRKMHIPDDPHYYEKHYFAPGDLGYRAFRTRYANIGVLICWDQWFPEAARLTAMSGAEIILIPTAIGYSCPEPDPSYQESWQVVQRGHAVANACYLAAVNRVGFEESPSTSLRTGPDGQGGIDFWGRSFVADPDGKVLKEASENEDEILVCPVDLAFVEEVRAAWSFPFRDRRVDSYGGLIKLYLD